MKLSLILQAIDRWSAPTRKAKAASDDLGRSMSPLGRRIDAARSSMRGFWGDTNRVEGASRRFGASIRRVAERDFAALRRGANAAKAATGGLLRNMALMSVRGAGYGLAGAAAAGGAAAGIFARGVIGNAAKFEQYQVALEGTEGSAKKAKAAMAWVQKFAKDTPYDIDTVTDSFVRARGVGIDPMTGAFRILGDAAGGTRKSLMDSVEAIADAQTGEFERLKEFNITSSSKGSQVTFSYIDKAGKQASKSVKKSMTEIRGAVLDIFDKKYGGGMERQAKTLTGIWNNLQDVITNFELSVAGKGIFDKVKNRLQGVLEYTDKLAKDGSLDRWAQSASDWMVTLFDKADHFVRDVDWKSVATGIGTIVSALVTVVGWIGKAAGAWSTWQNGIERRRLNMVLEDNGVWGTGLGASSPQDKQNARRQLNALDRDEYGQPQMRGAARGAWQGGRSQSVTNPWQRTRRETWDRAVQGSRGAKSVQGPLSPGKVAVDIRLSGPGASQASVRRVSTAGPVAATASRGPAMGGPA